MAIIFVKTRHFLTGSGNNRANEGSGQLEIIRKAVQNALKQEQKDAE